MSLATLTLAFLAGTLSILSPCVLPLVPIVLGAASSAHRWGPVALAAGLALSFTVLGMFVATIGFSIGLDAEWFRKFGAVLMILLGAVLLVPDLQARLAAAGGPASNCANQGVPLSETVALECKGRGWRGEAAKAITSDGSGLGLYLVDNIMQAMHGKLDVIPTDSGGWTRVRIVFSI